MDYEYAKNLSSAQQILLEVAEGVTEDNAHGYTLCSFCGSNQEEAHYEDCLMLRAQKELGDTWITYKHYSDQK